MGTVIKKLLEITQTARIRDVFFDKKLSANKSVIIPIFITILCLAPFLNKAFHIDDPLFIWTAKHIQTNPLDFYGFKVNWYRSEMPMAEVIKNPPLASYYMCLAGSLFGWSELTAHTFFLLPAIAAAMGTFYLAKQFVLKAGVGNSGSRINPRISGFEH